MKEFWTWLNDHTFELCMIALFFGFITLIGVLATADGRAGERCERSHCDVGSPLYVNSRCYCITGTAHP